MSQGSGLVERDGELEAIELSIASASRGDGQLLLVEGPPGVGKSTLVEATANRSTERGFTVLRASGAALEQDLGWGVVRGVFGPLATGEAHLPLREGPAGALFGAAAPSGGSDAVGAILYDLYWLLSDLTSERPAAVIVDDAHWADAASGRWLAHLAARVHELPVLLALASRASPQPPWWPVVAASSAARVLALEPLSRSGTRRVVTKALPSASAAVVDACHDATSGNPFLLSEVLRRASDGTLDPAQVRTMHPASIRRAVLVRLAELRPAATEATQLCYAIAILGQAATLTLAAELAGLDAATAATAATALERADVIRIKGGVEFVHPLVLDVIEREIPAAQRAALHGAAAELLAARGRSPGTIAPHLLAIEPSGRPELVVTLRAAAAEASALGAPETAAACLGRALAEPPASSDLTQVLFELGRAEGMLADPRGIERLRLALSRSVEPKLRATISVELARQLLNHGELAEAAALCREAAAGLPEEDRELRLTLQALAITVGGQDLDTDYEDLPPAELEQLTGATAGERLLLATVTVARLHTRGGSMPELCETASRTVAGGLPWLDAGIAESAGYWGLTALMVLGERYGDAERLVADAIEESRHRASPRGYAFCQCFGSRVHYRLGRLAEAAEDALAASAALAEEALVRAYAVSFAVDALIDLGELGEAQAALASVPIEDSPQIAAVSMLRFQAARVRLACGDLTAVADLAETGQRLGGMCSAFFPWRADVALALLQVGDAEGARALAHEELREGELEESRYVQVRALRALALAERSIDPLRRADELTRGAPIRLERARVLAELGAALRRRGHLREAGPVLREALELADLCGAVPLVSSAREELRAAGARPRRTQRTGRAALTPSELRVCQLAATGAGNRQIARALFVSLRTVETHLTHAYAKLGVSGRPDLPGALGDGTDEPFARRPVSAGLSLDAP